MTAQSPHGSPRGRTARRAPKKKKLRIKGRGRKRAARIRTGIALRVIIFSYPLSILGRSRPSVNKKGRHGGSDLAIVGGLTTSTFFTLIFLPTFYSISDSVVRRFKTRFGFNADKF
jgi:hypothetical protein